MTGATMSAGATKLVIPGTDYVSSVYLPGPPLLPVGQLGLSKDDTRRLDMEKDDLCTTFAVVLSECSRHIEATRRGFSLAACDDNPTVIGVIPSVHMIPGFLETGQRRVIVRGALLNHKARSDTSATRHKQEKMYRSPPKTCGDAAVATPRTPIGASTSRLETMVSPVCGMALAPGVQDADAEEKNARLRLKKRLARTKPGPKKKKATGSVARKRAKTGDNKPPRQPKIITSTTLAASKA